MTRTKKIILVAMALAAATLLIFATGGFVGIATLAGIAVLATIFARPLWGVVAVVFCGTCFQIVGSTHMTGLPLSLAKIIGLLAFASWLIYMVMNRRPLTYSPQMIPLGIFGLIIVVSAIINPSEEGAPVLEGLFKFLQLYLFYILISNMGGESKKALRVVCMALTLAITICGIIAILEFCLPSFAVESDDPRLEKGILAAVVDRESIASGDIKRVTGGLADANWLSYTMAAVIPLNIFWWRKFRSLGARMGVIAIASIQLLGLVLTYTRTGYLGLAVAAVFLMFKKRIPWTSMAMMFMVGIIAAMIWMPPGFTERILSVKYMKEGSTPMRRDLFRAAAHMIKERPLFGLGYGQYGYEFYRKLSTDSSMRVGAWGADLEYAVEEGQEQIHNIGAHSMYLEVLVEYGVIGFIPFVLWLFFVLKDCRLAEKCGDPELADLAVCLYAGAIAFYTCGILGHAKILKILWILAAMAAALRRVAISQDNNRPMNLATIEEPEGRTAV